MVVVKVIRNTYGGLQYVENMAKYVIDGREIASYGYGVSNTDPNSVYEQMCAVKEYYGKVNNNPLIQVVVSYDGKIANKADVCKFTKDFTEFFGEKNQTLGIAHSADHGNSNYHSHLDINAVSYKNGEMFNSGRKNLKPFVDHVKEVTGDKVKLVMENKDPMKGRR